jgi:hypothetical protein
MLMGYRERIRRTTKRIRRIRPSTRPNRMIPRLIEVSPLGRGKIAPLREGFLYWMQHLPSGGELSPFSPLPGSTRGVSL